MGTFEIDAPGVDVEALEKRVRKAIEEKRGVRFTDEELAGLRAMELEPRLRREDLPRGWLREMPEARSRLPAIEPPPGCHVSPPSELYESRSGGVKGMGLRLLRRISRPLYRVTSNLETTLASMIEATNEQGSWAGNQLSEMTGQLERWRERDLHLYHNIVQEITALRLQQTHMQDRINELIRRLDLLAERERALESLTVGAAHSDGAETKSESDSPKGAE